jgi:hypothetical protein
LLNSEVCTFCRDPRLSNHPQMNDQLRIVRPRLMKW